MSDIYHIPNDDGKYYRLEKFVEYQHEVPSIHYRFLGEYIKKHRFAEDGLEKRQYRRKEDGSRPVSFPTGVKRNDICPLEYRQ